MSSAQARLAAKDLCDQIADTARVDPIFGERAETRERAALKFEAKKYVDAVLDLATVEPSMVVEASRLDANPMLLNTPGGTVDLSWRK